MIPFILIALKIPDRLNCHEEQATSSIRDSTTKNASLPGETERLLSVNQSPGAPLSPDLNAEVDNRLEQTMNVSKAAKSSIWTEVKGCISSPVFLSVTFGYASYSAVVAGLGFYGPLFVQSNRPCDSRWNFSQTSADLYFGGSVVISGVMGTVLGGMWLDRKARKLTEAARDNRLIRIVAPSSAILWQVAVGGAICIVAAYMKTPTAFFALLFVGQLFIFMCTAGINLVINWSVRTEFRSMALAMSVLILHAFGDVPSPIAIGALADVVSPRMTMVLTLGWLGWAVLLWAITCVLVLRGAGEARKILLRESTNVYE